MYFSSIFKTLTDIKREKNRGEIGQTTEPFESIKNAFNKFASMAKNKTGKDLGSCDEKMARIDPNSRLLLCKERIPENWGVWNRIGLFQKGP